MTNAKRQEIFEYLGLGKVNKTNIKRFQKTAFSDPKEHDGIAGPKTDNALFHWYNVRKNTKNFRPEEFKCRCGRCTGYPTYMKVNELKHIQTIREHYGKPMEITSGLRCAFENRRVGGVANSGHLTGRAVDFHISGVTDTVKQRKSALAWIRKLPNHKFTYGSHMKGSDGIYRTASGMGNAMHTEVK